MLENVYEGLNAPSEFPVFLCLSNGNRCCTSPTWAEVQRGEAEFDFNLAEMDLTEVARGGPALTPLKATESKSKFNEAQPS